MKSITILQLSDLHLFKYEEQCFLQINPYLHLAKIVEQLIKNRKQIFPDLVVVTGDLVQDDSPEGYEKVSKILALLDLPVYATTGNHDNRKHFANYFGDPEKIVQEKFLNRWELLLMDTGVVNAVHGELKASSVATLSKSLEGDRSILLFMHHPIVPIHCSWLDESIVNNPQAFFKLIHEHPNKRLLKGIFCGHVHQATYAHHAGFSFFTAPAASWQFAPFHAMFSLGDQMPGYRWIKLHEDGSYSSVCDRLHYSNAYLSLQTVNRY